MENKMKKSSNTGSAAILAIIFIAIILIGVFLYSNSKSSANSIFTKQINDTIDSAFGKEVEEYKTLDSTVSITGNLQTQNEDYKQLADILNTSKISLNVKSDLNEKTEYIGLDVDVQNENLIKGNVYYTNNDKNLYIFVNELFDKYFKANINDVDEDGELKDLLDSAFEQNSTLAEKSNIEKIKKILKDEINSKLKDEYFSQNKEDGITKSTLKLTLGELTNIISEICNDLQNNEDFLNCYQDPSQVKTMLAELASTVNSEMNDVKDLNVEITLHTKGIFSQELVKLEISITDNVDTVTLNINKIDDNNYEFNVNIVSNENNITANIDTFKGTLKVEEVDKNTKKVTINVDVPDLGNVTLNIDVSYKINETIEPVDVSNNVDINQLSEDDYTKIYSNLSQMKIYQFIEAFLGE